MTTSVVLADDQALLRGSLRLLLDTAPGVECVAEAADGVQAVDAALTHRPDVVLMDIRMPRLDGIEATRRITTDPRTRDRTRVLVLTTFDIDSYVFAALRGGASGFLLKDTPPEQLLVALATIAAGEAMLSPWATRRLVEQFVESPTIGAAPRGLEELTNRERDVLALVSRGCSNAEIGEQLFIGMATTKTHVGRLLTKLGARDRAQLVIAAYESGLVRAAG